MESFFACAGVATEVMPIVPMTAAVLGDSDLTEKHRGAIVKPKRERKPTVLRKISADIAIMKKRWMINLQE